MARCQEPGPGCPCCALLRAAPECRSAGGTFELAQLQTEELRLLYQDPQQTYLTPYVARNFLNALELRSGSSAGLPTRK